MADARRTLARPDGARLAYRLWRPEAPRGLLVLLHGVASNMSRWAEFVGATRLRESWDLLRPDVRGYGESVHRGALGMEEWCADLAAILEAEGRAAAVVAGHCLGANIALEFAVRHPERVAGLVLVEPMFRQALTGPMARMARLRPLFVPCARLVRALNALGIHRRRLPGLDLEALDRQTRAAMASDGDQALARYASPRLDLRTTATGAYLAGLLAVTAPLPHVESVAAPTLALLARGSTFTDPALTARLLGPLRRGQVVWLPARHWIPTEQPEPMRRAIEAWCGQIIQRPPSIRID